MKEEDKNKVIEFFKNEVVLGFCGKDYFERIEWYFNIFFSPPATDKPTDEDLESLMTHDKETIAKWYLDLVKRSKAVTDEQIEKAAKELFESHMALKDESPTSYTHKTLCLHEAQGFRAGAKALRDNKIK
ncbi:MAG TPA: hypothetical protein VI911_00100 [Patescibacteria group bacterium]|nr:hypothetical protein [Patescibacteria group bacterium]